MIGRGTLPCIQILKFEPEKDALWQNHPMLKIELEQPTPKSTARSPRQYKAVPLGRDWTRWAG